MNWKNITERDFALINLKMGKMYVFFWSCSLCLILEVSPFLLSFTHETAEKVLLSNQISEMEILMDLHVIRSSDFENHILKA